MIRTAEATIQGTSALLMHQFPLEPIKALEKLTKEEQAEYTAYRCPDNGKLYIPGIAIQRGLIAGAGFEKGKGRATLAKPVAACTLVTPERVSLGITEFKIDSRPVVMPATRGRVIRHRARVDEWEVSFAIEFDPELITAIQMRACLDNLGSRVGLLDFRPERKGPFGRFIVTSWKV